MVWLAAICGTYFVLSSSNSVLALSPDSNAQKMAQPPQHPAFLSTFPLAMGLPLSLNIGFFFLSSVGASPSLLFFSSPFYSLTSFFDAWLATSKLICSRSTSSPSAFYLLFAGIVFALLRYCSSRASGLAIATHSFSLRL